jgi:hypothetical protein
MPIKLPSTIKMGGHMIKVLHPYEFKERSDLAGQISWGSKEIRIAYGDSGGEKYADTHILQTFLHEVIHGFDNATGNSIFNADDHERREEWKITNSRYGIA